MQWDQWQERAIPPSEGMRRTARENEEVFRAQSTPVPPYTTGGDSVQPDIADKAVTVGEGASPDAPEEFPPCYYL